MKTFFAVVLGVGLGAGGMYGWQSYQERQAEEALQAAFQNVDENTKTFMRCIGMTE
jgi:predicted negative regulator of RcsB-dependent stress response